jgi:hypothetical protein
MICSLLGEEEDMEAEEAKETEEAILGIDIL